MESALRPREIQARIRAGASVAQVAAAAGVSVDEIERFAHPVLLERSRATEMAASSHPSVSTALRCRRSARWSPPHSARAATTPTTPRGTPGGDDNRWVVQVAWRVGRSENRAHWRFLPGSSGGTTEPLDEMADELTDAEPDPPAQWFRLRRHLATPPTARPSGRPARSPTRSPSGAGGLIHAQRSRSRHTGADSLIESPEPETATAAPEPAPRRMTESIRRPRLRRLRSRRRPHPPGRGRRRDRRGGGRRHRVRVTSRTGTCA